MTGMLRDLLNERADAAGSHDLDLQDLIAQGERSVRRRRGVALGGTVAAVALTVGASFALVQAGDRGTSPVGPPSTGSPSAVDTPPDTTDGSQPLTYGVGGTIHYGDRIIEAEDAEALFVFDDGLAVLTGSDDRTGGTLLFFDDAGSDPVEIARGIEMLTSGNVGSLLVWLDGDDVVIYDVDLQSVVARVPLNGRRLAHPITPLANAVYWTEYDDSTATSLSDGQLVRYDVSTGNRSPASEADYRVETRQAASPVLVIGSAESMDPAEDFIVVDSRLELDNDAQGARPPVFVAATGERLRVSVPARYDGITLDVFQWLDDDRFALVANSGVKRAPIGDLLVCRISAGECHTVASGEQDWLLLGPEGALH